MSKKIYKIAVLVDDATLPNEDGQFVGVPEKMTTEYCVVQAIRRLGYEVSIVPVGDDIIAVANELRRQEPELIFNLTEEFAGDRRNDKNIAAMLELLAIPFTGTGSNGLMLCRDKMLCKYILAHHRIRVPKFAFFSPGRAVKAPKSIPFPLVVKPAFEDGSDGISNASVVNDFDSLRQRIEFVTGKWEQDAIAEEYIVGREFYVGILGNKKLTALPIRECVFNNKDTHSPCLATYRVKWDKEYREKWNINYGFAELDQKATKNIEQVCKRAYSLLQLRDYGRIDLRLTEDGKIVIIEVNPNPDVAFGEDLSSSAERAGIGYDAFIEHIIHDAVGRYKI